jgi:hypothetical protein
MKTNKKHIIEELQELKAESLLSQFNENQDMPEGYFENLSTDFLANISKEENKVQTKIVSIRKIFLTTSMAATLLVLLAIPLFKDNSQTVSWDQFSSSDFVDYLEDNIDEFSDEEIASVSVLSDNSIFLDAEYSDELLEEYLLEMDLEETLF